MSIFIKLRDSRTDRRTAQNYKVYLRVEYFLNVAMSSVYEKPRF